MRRDEITCSVSGCESFHKEDTFNQGHFGWGDITGIVDESGEGPHFCPDCMSKIKIFLDTGEIK